MLENLLGVSLWNELTGVVSPNKLTEIRIRIGKPITVRDFSKRYFLSMSGSSYFIEEIVGRATKYSLYAYQEEISAGYLYFEGGIRIGVSGRGVVRDGNLGGFREINSLNIRIPHEVKGCSRPLNDILNRFDNTLVISPPFGGKTTLIRDMAAELSKKYDVCIIDERGELTGGNFEFGPMLDVVSNVPKSVATEGIIRALSPQIIVLDEIYPKRDMETLEEISRAGVRFIASAHSDSLENLARCHPSLISLFRYGVELSDKPSVGHIKSIMRLNCD